MEKQCEDIFDHYDHENLFPLLLSCHQKNIISGLIRLQMKIDDRSSLWRDQHAIRGSHNRIWRNRKSGLPENDKGAANKKDCANDT